MSEDNRRTTSDHAGKFVTLLDIRTLCNDITTDKKIKFYFFSPIGIR